MFTAHVDDATNRASNDTAGNGQHSVVPTTGPSGGLAAGISKSARSPLRHSSKPPHFSIADRSHFGR